MPWPTGRPNNGGYSTSPIRTRRGMPLRRRLLVSSLLGTIPLIILGIILLISRYFGLRDLLLTNNLTQAKLASAYTAGWLEGQIRTLRTIALSNEIQQGSLADKRALAFRQVRAQPEWDSIWITDARGQEIVDTEGRLVNVEDRDYFVQTRRTRRPVISNIIIGRISGQQLIAITYPILGNDGAFLGLVAAGVRPREIQRIFSQVTADRGNIIGLWGNDRRLIARTDTPEHMIGQEYTAADSDSVLSGHTGTAISTSPVNHQRVLIGYAPVEIAKWTVVSAVPLSTAFIPVARSMTFFIVAASLVLAATLLWSLYSANIVAGQVSLLANSARAIGEEKLDTRVTLATGGELEDLANSLNKMAADLQVIERMKSELLSMVSHELKTPLTSIRTSLEILSEGLVTPENPRYREVIEIADRQSRRLQDMIENLLNVARTDAGGLSITPRPTDLVPLVMASVKLFEEAAHARGLTITTELPPALPVLADPPKITLVLNNLLDNAIKFTEHGGVTVAARVEGSYARITVTDTGLGLRPEVRNRLFEKFYQGEPLLTRKAGGSGLGLFVTKTLVEGHGGTVFAESEGPGSGSTFGFTLPLVEKTA